MSTRTSLLKRFDELIKFAEDLSMEDASSLDFLVRKARWQTSCLHLLEKIFGSTNVYYKKLERTVHYTDESQLAWGVELMIGAREEVENGLLYKVEHIISADLFDSIVEQAEYLTKNGYKDVAAILGRVIVENTLKDIAKRENITIPEKIQLSELNKLLWKNEVYAKNIWRSIQAQIDLGNYAAHGEFEKFDEKSVSDMMTWIRETLLNL